ncbi:MAG: VPLPA-CTERM sorting domain-containing protein [Gammaproteobacteria bacterium]|nr:VPLPA-CTERM sorting domain-containing protein [Gammaproteobacteria bacterium]
MKKTILAAGLLCLAGPLQAATINLTDGQFSAVSYETFVQGPIGPIIGFSETVDDVTFTIARISGQFRGVGAWGDGSFDSAPFELDFGGGGGSVSSFTLMASRDVTLDTFSGMAQQFNTAPIFDVIGPNVASIGNAFSVSGFLGSDAPGTDPFVNGPLSLQAGAVYTFSVSNAGAATRGYITELGFSVAPVPLPPAALLMLSGLAGLTMLRRRR